MTTYHKFQKLKIDHSVIGLDQNISDVNYFCTPVGAKVIGEAGVDGIHYCFINGFGEMIFAISPSDLPGENVHPITKNFEDLLRLLLACGSMDAIEQTYMWNEESFEQYIMDNKPCEKQRVIMNVIKEEFQIMPMEQPFYYIKDLQAAFDYGELKFPEEYYEMLPEDLETETEAKWVLEHYGYDYEKAWAVHRVSYPWADKKPRMIRTLEMQLEREMVKIPSKPFTTPGKEKVQEILNPVTGVVHTFTVREYEEREMDPNQFPDESMEWPTHYSIMTYTLFPELEDVYLKDACHGDSPRSKQGNQHRGATSVGIIGLRPKTEDGEDYYHPDGTVAKLRVCCSSMYFEKPEKIEWILTFREKRVPDIQMKLI